MGRQNVAIVGAGPSGLVTAKELLQEGHSVTCFEKTDSVGGIFRFRPDASSVGVWQSCRLTSSIFVTRFSDFFPNWRDPVPFEHRHMTHQEYVAYLEQYAAHFDILPHVRLRCTVMEVVQNDGGWRVTIHDTARDEEEIHRFDSVAICSGIHSRPHFPTYPGLETFRGQVLHAAHYRNPSSIRGKSAVFIGAGESGGEIVAEAAPVLEHAYLSLRRGVFVIPRLLNGLPNDYAGTRLLYSLPEFVSRRSDAEAGALKRRVELVLFPLTVARTLLVWLLDYRRDRTAGRQKVADGTSLDALVGQVKEHQEAARKARIEGLITLLRKESGGNQFETFATKTEAFVEAIVDGQCELRPAVESVTPTGVIFSNGKAVDVDSIILCTGYEKASAPFVRATVDVERLYKNCFDPDLREGLAFIGFVRPPIGSIPPMAELQARWYAQVLSGNLQLPSADQMRAEIERALTSRETYHQRVFRRIPQLVDFSTYLDGLAEIIDCKPRARDLLLRPRLLYKLYTSPFAGVQYRLRGPHAQTEMATRLLLHAHSHARVVRFLDVAFAEIARLLGFTRFQPHLSLIGKIGHRKSSRVT